MPKGTDGMTDEDLAVLTPEELAALNEETSPEEAAARRLPPSGDQPNADDDAGTQPTAVAPAAAGDTEVIESPKPQPTATPAEPAATPAEPPADSEPFVPRMPVGEPVDHQARLAELAKQFEDGEISTADYNKQFAEIITAQSKAELAAEYNAKLEQDLWDNAKADFFERNEQYKTSRPLFGALATEISAIESERIDKKLAPLSNAKLLEQAHANVMREFGQVPPSAQPRRAPTSRVGDAPNLKDVPVTLAGVPAADAAETGRDRFAELDKLAETNVDEYERSLAAMPDADVAAYLAMQ